jgi:hypothetical protein
MSNREEHAEDAAAYEAETGIPAEAILDMLETRFEALTHEQGGLMAPYFAWMVRRLGIEDTVNVTVMRGDIG